MKNKVYASAIVAVVSLVAILASGVVIGNQLALMEEPIVPSIPALPSSNEQVVMEPNLIQLVLDMVLDSAGEKQPALTLFSNVGTGCDRVSPLEISQYTVGKETYLDIGAFAMRKGASQSECVKEQKATHAVVPVNSILPNGTKQAPTLFILGDKKNSYTLSKDSNAVYLEPILAQNVVMDTASSSKRLVLCLKKGTGSSLPVECRD